MKKEKMMAQINRSHYGGGLTCSFNDYQLSEFIQMKQRCQGKLPMKKAVVEVGPQADGSWSLGPSLHFDNNGQLLDTDQSKYIWIGHLYDGPGIASCNTACPIHVPLSTDPLRNMVTWAKAHLKHNFIPSMLVVGGSVMSLHYSTMVEKLFFCPVPIAFSPKSGTGKTTAVKMGVGTTGGYPSRLVSKASSEKYFDLCTSSYLPLGVDDPKSKNAIGDLAVSLFNGAMEATVSRGAKVPKSMAVISANFTIEKKER